jgi:arylsulfatase A-like enzyme
VGDRVSPVIGETFDLRMHDLLQTGKVVLSPEDLAYAGDLYDGDLHAADREVGALLELLKQSGLSDRTAIVVTSDHGEEMGDHYPAFIGDHGHVLYDSLVHVPLLLKNPLRSYPARTVAAQVRGVDVLPTIAELLDVPPGAPVDGSSLVPLLEGKPEPERIALSAHTRVGPPRASVRALGHEYVEQRPVQEDWPPLRPEPPARELYDLAIDPGEKTNLIDRRPEVARTLKNLLDAGRRHLSEPRKTAVPDEVERETLERLRSLGYLR